MHLDKHTPVAEQTTSLKYLFDEKKRDTSDSRCPTLLENILTYLK